MDQNVIMKGILDSYPYPIVFVDSGYVIRYMNRYAEYHYYKERIRSAFEQMKKDGKERFVGVNTRNLRIIMQPVRDEEGTLIGFFERFELNLHIEQR